MDLLLKRFENLENNVITLKKDNETLTNRVIHLEAETIHLKNKVAYLELDTRKMLDHQQDLLYKLSFYETIRSF